MTDYDRDPEALAWARAKVQEAVDKAEACAANTQLIDETREGWRQTASFIRHELVSRDGAAYAAFDERWPSLVNAAPAATEATEPEHVCKPGATTYFCPASGEMESDCHGGFDQCCDRPDLHRPTAETGPCPACRRADQAGLAPDEQHPECAPQEQPDMPS